MNDQCIKLLLVEDEAVCAALVQEMLTSASASPFAVTRVKRLGEALERVGQDRFDVALFTVSAADGIDGLTAMLWDGGAGVGTPRTHRTASRSGRRCRRRPR